MTRLEQMEAEARDSGFRVLEVPLQHTDGMVNGKYIGLRKGQTTIEKTCVLAEELAHAQFTVGDIIDQSDVANRKQECFARLKAYDRLIGLSGIVLAFKHGCRSRYEMAEYLEVTEEFLQEALECYHKKYGLCVRHEKHMIQFEPSLSIGTLF